MNLKISTLCYSSQGETRTLPFCSAVTGIHTDPYLSPHLLYLDKLNIIYALSKGASD